MMQVMKDIGGVEMPEFLAKLQADAQAPKVEPVVNGRRRRVNRPAQPDASEAPRLGYWEC